MTIQVTAMADHISRWEPRMERVSGISGSPGAPIALEYGVGAGSPCGASSGANQVRSVSTCPLRLTHSQRPTATAAAHRSR